MSGEREIPAAPGAAGPERARQTSAEGSWIPRRVLFLTPRWARDGGVGAHVLASAAALAKEGAEVTALVTRIGSYERIPGVTVCHCAQLLDAKAPLAHRLGAALEHGPELAHLHQVDDPELVQALRKLAPVAISAHGYTACTAGVHYFRPGQECARPHGPGCIPNLPACAHVRNPAALPRRYRNASRGLRALQTADIAISYSSAVDRHLAANGIARRAIVPYFPTVSQPPQAPPEGRRRVMFAGRVIPAKGADVLIRAAARIDAEIVICGDGRQLEADRRLASRLGIAARVQFTGWLSPRELAEQLGAAAVVALPSIWPEPFGLVGIEGHAAARPAVASATGGVADWLQDGVNGLMVRPGDASALAGALDELLGDPARRRMMGEAGRERVARCFSIQRHLAVLAHAYDAARRSWHARDGAGPAAPAAAGRAVLA